MSRTRRLTEELVRLATREVADAGPMPGFEHFSETEYDEHLDAFLLDRPDGPLHVFAYGSLIWKPVYEPASRSAPSRPVGIGPSASRWRASAARLTGQA